ncbi:MAG: hypothetical protein AAF404_18360 [Pseudomonadota bacterium]
MSKNFVIATIVASAAMLGACASTAPVSQTSLSGEAEPATVTCTDETPCDTTLKQRYQYYLGLWSTIFLN